MRICIICICLFLADISNAQLVDSTFAPDQTETDWGIVKSIPRDAWQFVSLPARWDNRQWFTASGLIATTAALMFADEPIRNFMQSNRSNFTDDISYVAEWGGPKISMGLATSYLLGSAIKDEKLRKASLLSLTSILVSGGLVQIMKQSFSRVRPFEASNQWQFNGPFSEFGRHTSFPSGHASTAFAVAAVFSTVYDTHFVKILSYSLASLTALSRVNDDVHWASDVFVGAVLGTLTGKFIAKQHMRNRASSPTISLNPTILNIAGQSGYGLSLRVSLKQ